MSSCIEWTRGLNKDGYGVLRKGGKCVYAHREVYTAANGPIPENYVVRHSCDNRNCINLDHLELGTQGDNMNDRSRRGGNPVKKLSDADVIIIKQRLLSYYRGLGQELALEYGVTPALISQIRNNAGRFRG